MTIKINIEDSHDTRVEDAMCARFGYTGYLADSKTEISKYEFVRSTIITWLKSNVVDHEANVASCHAYKEAQIEANNISIT